MDILDETISINNLTINGSLILNSDPNNPLIISSELLSVLKKAPFVTISTNQLISGNKIFKNPIKYNFEELDPTLADNTLVTAEWVLNQGFSTFSGQGSVSISSAETITGLKTFSQAPKYSGTALNLTTNDGTFATTEFVKDQGYLTTTSASTVFQLKSEITYLNTGIDGYVLKSNGPGTTPGWVSTVPSAGTATHLKGGNAWSLVYQSALDTTSFLPVGTAGQVLQSNGLNLAPIWADIHLSDYLTINTASDTYQRKDTSILNASLATNISGGVQGDLIYQNGINSTNKLSIGTNGQVLTSNGTTPIWSSITTTNSNISGGTIGSILYQSAANTTSFLPIGTNGQVLQCNGTSTPIWGTNPVSQSVNPTTTLDITNTNANYYLTWCKTNTTGSNQLFTNTNLSYNPYTDTLSANALTATTASTLLITNDSTATNINYFLPWCKTNASGTNPLFTNNNLSYNPSTDTLSANALTATTASTLFITNDSTATNAYYYLTWCKNVATGANPLFTNTNLKYNINTKTIYANAETATTATTLLITNDVSTPSATYYLPWCKSNATGSNPLFTNSNLKYNSLTNTISANAETATTATTLLITNDVSTPSATYYLPWCKTNVTGSNPLFTNSNLKYNPGTNTLTAATFNGNATTATTASHINGGNAGNILYQSATNTTTSLTNPTKNNSFLTFSNSVPNWNDLLTINKMVEVITPLTSSSLITLDYSLSAIFSLTAFSSNFTINITNFPETTNRVYKITLYIDSTTYKTYANSIQINSVVNTILYEREIFPISISNTNALLIEQSFSIIRLNSGDIKVLSKIKSMDYHNFN